MPATSDDDILVKFEEHLSRRALSSSTIVNYLADLRTFRRWAQQEISSEFSLLQVNQEHIRRYRHHLAHTLKRAASTTNRHLMSLRKFFTFATGLGIIAADPTAGVALVQDNELPASKTLTRAETEKLLQTAANGTRAGLVRRDLAILQLLLQTGLRISEIVDLQKDDLVFDNPGVCLQVAPGTAQFRKIPISRELRKVLSDYLQVRPQSGTSNLFLSQDGRAISKRTVQRIISHCAKSAALHGVSAQSIRRTFAVNLYTESQDMALVSRRLGHQNTSITEQYLAPHTIPAAKNNIAGRPAPVDEVATGTNIGVRLTTEFDRNF